MSNTYKNTPTRKIDRRSRSYRQIDYIRSFIDMDRDDREMRRSFNTAQRGAIYGHPKPSCHSNY